MIAPFLPIIGAIALLYIAFKTNFLGIRDTVAAFSVAMKALWAWIKPVFIGIKTLVVDVVGKLIKTVTGWFTDWNSQFESGKTPLLRLAGTIVYAIGFIVGIFQRIPKFFKSILDSITGLFKFMGESVKNVFIGIFTFIKKMLFGYVNLYIETINKVIGLVNKIPGVNIPIIPKLATNKVGIELYEFTKSDNLVSKSPWTVKTADAGLKVGVEESEAPKLPIMKAIIEPIFAAIPVITVFAKAILLEPLDAIFGSEHAVAGGAGIVPPPNNGSYITNALSNYNSANSHTNIDRRVGTVNFHIHSANPIDVVREIERYFDQLASQGAAVENVEIS